MALLGGEDAGGQNVYVHEVSRHIARLGYQVDIFCRRDNGVVPEVVRWGDGVRVIHLRAGPAEFIKKDPMWKLMPEFRDSFLRFCRYRQGHYDLIHSNFWMSGWVACELKRRLDLPVVHISHAWGKTKRLEQGEADTSPPDRVEVEHRTLCEVDRIIAQCPDEVNELGRLYNASVDKVRVVPTGVNIKTFYPVSKAEARAKLGLRAEDKVVVYIGRMVRRKGVDNLIEGFARLRARQPNLPLRLIVVGGETEEPDPERVPELGYLMALAASLGVRDRVWFTGKRQQSELKDYYSAADVAVSTPWYEPYGLTPLEAQACGTPVIGSAVGGIPFTVAEGETGFLVPPKDPEALSDRLARIATDPALQATMSYKARARVEREFTWERTAHRTAAVYEEVLTERGVSAA